MTLERITRSRNRAKEEVTSLLKKHTEEPKRAGIAFTVKEEKFLNEVQDMFNLARKELVSHVMRYYRNYHDLEYFPEDIIKDIKCEIKDSQVRLYYRYITNSHEVIAYKDKNKEK